MNKVCTLLVMLGMSLVKLQASEIETQKYYVDQAAMDATISNAEDMSLAMAQMHVPPPTATPGEAVEGRVIAKRKAMFLVLNVLFGGVAVHRYYMGVDGAWYMFAGYCCVPIASDVAHCGDFFYVLFSHKETVMEYKDNSRWFVWGD